MFELSGAEKRLLINASLGHRIGYRYAAILNRLVPYLWLTCLVIFIWILYVSGILKSSLGELFFS
jgi:hypothetical protein